MTASDGRVAMGRPLPLVLLHGWGFDASVWDSVRELLADWPIHVVDAGYFGHPSMPCLPESYVAVGHSLGAMRCLAETGPGCRGWVLINGFARFSAAADFPEGVPVRVIDRMLMRLAADPAAVVDDFRKRCGAPAQAPASGLDGAALAEDLRRLRDEDARDAWTARQVPACVLAGEADPVVAPTMTRASFGEDVGWCAGGGHLLPLTHAAWCAARIRAFANALAGSSAGVASA